MYVAAGGLVAGNAVGILAGRLAPPASSSAATIVPIRRGEIRHVSFNRTNLALTIASIAVAIILAYWQIVAGR